LTRANWITASRPEALLATYSIATGAASLLLLANYGFQPFFFREVTFSFVGLIAAAAVWKAERLFAPVILLLAMSVGTIELLGNASVIPESLFYAWDGVAPADFGLVLHVLRAIVALIGAACALSAAEALAARMPAADRNRLQRIVGPVVVLEAVIFLMIAKFGLGAFQPSHLQISLLMSQLPAIWLLQKLGWCCGYSGGLVLTDSLDLHWGGLTPLGVPILFITNSALVAAVFAGARSVLLLVVQRFSATAAPNAGPAPA
jgi:hypothetical protein